MPTKEIIMCKGPNEPGGPHRCGGHARKAMQDTASIAAEAEITERAANAERSAMERAYSDSNDAKVNMQRELLRSTDKDEQERLRQEITAEAKVEARLYGEKEQAGAAYRKAETEHRQAEQRHSEAVYAYDATTEGLLTLTNEINQRDAAWQRAIDQNPRDEHGVATLTSDQMNEIADINGLVRRRERAEDRMAEESRNRNGAVVDSAESYQEAEEAGEARFERAQALRDHDAATNLDERREAKERLAAADKTLDDIAKRDRFRSMLKPYTGADRGKTAFLEDHTWRGVSSGHRTIVGTDGRPKVQVALQRDVDGVRTQRVVEMDAALVEQQREHIRRTEDADSAKRYPTTAHVLRTLGQDFGKLNSKGRTWPEFKANGGSRDEYDRGVRAQKALSGLFGGGKVDAEERELIDA